MNKILIAIIIIIITFVSCDCSKRESCGQSASNETVEEIETKIFKDVIIKYDLNGNVIQKFVTQHSQIKTDNYIKFNNGFCDSCVTYILYNKCNNIDIIEILVEKEASNKDIFKKLSNYMKYKTIIKRQEINFEE